jgi:tetratricopeptide (TPR) repeat protein
MQFQYEKGLFLIYDYPEEQGDRTRLLFEKIAEMKSTDAPVRVLFLSRRGFDTWQNEALMLEGRFGRQAVAAPGPLVLAEALALVEEATRRFAAAAGMARPDLSGAAEWLEQSDTHRMPLFSSAAAIHAVLAPGEPFGLDGAALMRDLARRELRRVRQASPALGIGEYGLERLLALGVLGDGLNEKAIAALNDAGALPGSEPDFSDRLKRSSWWRDMRLARLVPDRPAAAFLNLTLFDRRTAPAGDPRLPEWLYRALEERAASFAGRLGRTLYDLDMLSHESEGTHALDACLVRMLTDEPARVDLFAKVASGEVPFSAANFAAHVAVKLAERSTDPSAKALYLSNASSYLSTLGRREEALTCAQEAAVLYRALARARPEPFTPDLAMSLNNLAAMLSALGRREEALTCAEDAARLYRDLARARPEEFTPNLAMSLNNLANMLSELGRREEALTCAQEAARLYRDLARARPEAFTFTPL